MRKRLYEVLTGEECSKASFVYACVMVAFIVASLVPLCFHERIEAFNALELACVVVFVVDYILRWATADLKLHKGARSFLMYPFTLMAIIDLVSIIPFFFALDPTLRTLRAVSLLRTFRAFRLLRYSRGLALVGRAIKRQAVPLFFVCLLTVGYVFVSAIVMFNTEPQTFSTYFDAVYWAVVTLATIGYGDFHPVTEVGRFISMLSALFGVGIVALPASIITAGYLEVMQELQENRKRGLSDAESSGDAS